MGPCALGCSLDQQRPGGHGSACETRRQSHGFRNRTVVDDSILTSIHTNLASLRAQSHLGVNSKAVWRSIERLSTGLRINKAADDPAGLIASEALRGRAVAIAAAIGNCRRADTFIAIAEGALDEVSVLLLDIMGLTLSTANTAALSRKEIDANQLLVDAAVNAINRIANTTTFGGRNILDGSIDYTLSGVGDTLIPIARARVNHAQVPQSSAIPVTIEILTEGKQAEQSWRIRRAFLEAAKTGTSSIELASDIGTHTFNFSTGSFTAADVVQAFNDAEALTGVTATLVPDDQIKFVSNNYGPAASLTIRASQPAGAYWAQSGGFLDAVDGEWVLKVGSNQGIRDLIFGDGETPSNIVTAVNNMAPATGLRAVYEDGEFAFTSEATGPTAWALVQVLPRVYFEDDDSTDVNQAFGGVGTPAGLDWSDYAGFLAAAVTGTSRIEVTGNDGVRVISFDTGVFTPADIVTAVNDVTADTGVTASFAAGTITFSSVGVGSEAFVKIRGFERPQVDWVDQSDFLTASLSSANVIQVNGAHGTRTITFDSAVFTPTDIVNAVNGVTANTGVSASLAGGVITFASDEYGPYESVWIKAMHPIPALTEPIDLTENVGTSTDVTTNGGDGAIAVKTINHNPATVVSGLQMSLDSLDLSVDLTFDDFVGQSVGGKGIEGVYSVFTTFYITGGGMNFQITPDMTIQGRISSGIPSIAPSNLGNPIVGFLSDIVRGASSSLVSGGAGNASEIVDAAIQQVAFLRGELGTIRKYTLEPMIASQQVALENTMAGESAIRDADFAIEMSALTRAKILSQAVSRAMIIANAQPLSILQLLR